MSVQVASLRTFWLLFTGFHLLINKLLNNQAISYVKDFIVLYHSNRALSDCWLTCGKLFKIRMEGRARPLFCGTNPKFGLERVRERDTLYF